MDSSSTIGIMAGIYRPSPRSAYFILQVVDSSPNSVYLSMPGQLICPSDKEARVLTDALVGDPGFARVALNAFLRDIDITHSSINLYNGGIVLDPTCSGYPFIENLQEPFPKESIDALVDCCHDIRPDIEVKVLGYVLGSASYLPMRIKRAVLSVE